MKQEEISEPFEEISVFNWLVILKDDAGGFPSHAAPVEWSSFWLYHSHSI